MREFNFKSLSVFSVLFVLFYNSDCKVPYNDVKSDYETLLSAYRTASTVGITDVIPKDVGAGPVLVYIGISLYAIMDYDGVSGKIQLVSSMKMEWLDEVKTLTGTTFKESIQTLFVAYDQIWTPNLVLMSAVDSVKRIGDETYKVRYNVSSGYCKWYPRMIINAACTPDMTYYPFDKQICTLTITPWNQGITELQLVPLTNEWNTDNIEKSGTWEVDKTSTEVYIGSNNTRYHVDFKITIKRKPLFLALVIVLPVLLLSLLTGFIFLLPPGSGSRVGFGITCFLSFVVLLQTLMGFMPEVSSPMSILCFYVIFMLSFSVLLSIANVFLLRMYLNPSKEEVPRIFLILLEVITCKIWRRCPKCPEVRFSIFRKLWKRCQKCFGFFKPHSANYTDKVHNIRFSRRLLAIKEASTIRNRFTSKQEEGACKEDDSADVSRSHGGKTRVTDRRLTRSAKLFIGSAEIGAVNDEAYSAEQPLGFGHENSSPAINHEHNVISRVNSEESSGYSSATSSNNQSQKQSGPILRSTSAVKLCTLSDSELRRSQSVVEPRLWSGSGLRSQSAIKPPILSESRLRRSQSEVELLTQSDTGFRNRSTFKSRVPPATGSQMSADESRVQSSQESQSGSAAESRIQPVTPVQTANSDSKKEITWEYIAQVLDLFFLAVFCTVQTIFTIFFLVPLGAQY